MSQNHPLPTPPQQDGRPYQHERAKSSFSHHSRKSSGSGSKGLSETHQEKEARRLHSSSKADPSTAITEAEPSAVAAREAVSLSPIRAIQHRDYQGNPIADPDRSNPTRSRWERPLDTIRSFEAAIDGNYSRKSSYARTESGDTASNYNRRSSYFGGTQVSTDERPRYPQNGYYGGGRSSSYRQENPNDPRSNGMNRADSYYNGDGGGPSNGYNPNRGRYARTASEPQFTHGGYAPNGNPQSYETGTNGSGSTGEPIGYQTDPSSENSSVDRIAPAAQRNPGEAYGFNGFGESDYYHQSGNGYNEQYMTNAVASGGYGDHGDQPPPVPRKANPGTRVPIQLGSSDVGSPVSEERLGVGEKRKSWFGKRFSKS